VLIVNGAGFEEFLEPLLKNAGGQRLLIEASRGLTPRQAQQLEATGDHPEGDPHFWLDPTKVVTYVTNIRDGLSSADPAGAATYAANAGSYIKQLNDLDLWIKAEVSRISEKDRMLVTNHESLGYFADRYGFRVVGSIMASVSTSASPSAQELVQLVTSIRQTGAQAIFLETGTNPQMAQQVARETGVKVVQDLYTHSTTIGAPAPTYIEMMKANTAKIVEALK
jgi:ABC-type Zn uptake system ZnuABC Zn-binding protein ZnuA